MDIVYLLFISILGLVSGSFIGALTYRLPRDIPIQKGRSWCDNCKHTLSWVDNIPVISYVLLGGRCHYCHKKVSMRYPIIETLTALVFLLTYIGSNTIQSTLPWIASLGFLQYPLLFVIDALLVTILVIDWEHQIIPDVLVLFLVVITLTGLFVSGTQVLASHLLAGFLAAFILLLVHLATLGRGMGLGDVKLAIFGGLFLGIEYSIVWLLLSFMVGGFFGIILLIFKLAHLKDKIAFGPFLIAGLFILLLIPIGILKDGII